MYEVEGRVPVHFGMLAPDDNSMDGRDDWRPAIHRLTGEAKEVKVAGGVDENDELATVGDIARDLGCDPVIVNCIIREHGIELAKSDGNKLYDYEEVMEAVGRHPDYLEYVGKGELIALAGTSIDYFDKVASRGLAPEGRKFGNRVLYKAADADMLTTVVYKMIADDDAIRKREASRKSKEYQRQWRAKRAAQRKAEGQSPIDRARERGLIPITDLLRDTGLSPKSIAEDIRIGMLHVTEKTSNVRYFSREEVDGYLKLLSGYSLVGAAKAAGVHVHTLQKWEKLGVFQALHFGAHRIVVMPGEMEKARAYAGLESERRRISAKKRESVREAV